MKSCAPVDNKELSKSVTNVVIMLMYSIHGTLLQDVSS